MPLSERIIERVKTREAFAMKKYGKPLDPSKDKRNFLREALEEVIDALFYLEAQIIKGNRDKRYRDSAKGQARDKRYKCSSKSRAAEKRYAMSSKGKATYKRYTGKPEVKEHRKWLQRSFRKRRKIDSAIL